MENGCILYASVFWNVKKKKKELILSNNDANGGLSIEPGAAEQNLIIYIKCKSALTTPYIF